uniref:PDZ domain-containing protein n=1 Tax=Mesocestoides corti TaxID=53468 RepID=A0A5K3FTN9_MESCO
MKRAKPRFPGLNVGGVFSLGMPHQLGGRIFSRDGSITSLEGISDDLLERLDGHGAYAMERINKEIRLVISFEEVNDEAWFYLSTS